MVGLKGLAPDCSPALCHILCGLYARHSQFPAAPAGLAVPDERARPRYRIVPKLSSSSFDGHYQLRLQANLELKLDDVKTEKRFKLDKVPLVGDWHVCVER